MNKGVIENCCHFGKEDAKALTDVMTKVYGKDHIITQMCKRFNKRFEMIQNEISKEK